MPLFGAEYEVETDRDKMAWEAKLESGDRVMISPHLCDWHQHDASQDHRGWIDVTFLDIVPPGFYVPYHMTIDLEQASILVEGLTAVGEWAHLNQQLREQEG